MIKRSNLVSVWRKFPWFFAVISGALLVSLGLDFHGRIWAPRDQTLRSFSPPQTPPTPVGVGKSTVEGLLSTWFPSPAVPDVQLKPEREFRLQATLISNRLAKAVFLINATDSQPEERVLLSVGEVIEGWTIKSIAVRKVVVTKAEQMRSLEILKGSIEG